MIKTAQTKIFEGLKIGIITIAVASFILVGILFAQYLSVPDYNSAHCTAEETGK